MLQVSKSIQVSSPTQVSKPTKSNIRKVIISLVFLFAIYPVFVLGYVWINCAKSGFIAGKNGQLDAYRHTLASAVVSYTLTPKAVGLVTRIMERKSGIGNLMDRHNNAIGSEIGANAQSLNQVNDRVIQHVKQGAVNAASHTQTTWLPESFWAKSFFW